MLTVMHSTRLLICPISTSEGRIFLFSTSSSQTRRVALKQTKHSYCMYLF